MSKKRNTAKAVLVPRRLPPCWWVAVRRADDSLELLTAHDTQEAAGEDAAYWRKQAKGWIDKPQSVEVLREHPRRRCQRISACGIGRPSQMTARSNWFRRNQNLLETLRPRRCRVLLHSPGKAMGKPADLLGHLMGGPAVLPRGTPWPTFSGVYNPGRSRRQKRPGTYLGTYDLRGCFTFGQHFPAAISIFLCTDPELSDEYQAFADPYCDAGHIIPLFAKQELELVGPPAGIEVAPPGEVAAWELLDLPPYSTDVWQDLNPTLAERKRREKVRNVYEAIEEMEPGTSSWINIIGNKIGGYVRFIQNNLLMDRARAQPGAVWHPIATYAGGEVMLGDAGILYVLAGLDRKNKRWKWHCEWQCH